jgi:hypothetical protein
MAIAKASRYCDFIMQGRSLERLFAFYRYPQGLEQKHFCRVENECKALLRFDVWESETGHSGFTSSSFRRSLRSTETMQREK